MGEVVYALNECMLRLGDFQTSNKPLGGASSSSMLASSKPGGSGIFAGSIEHDAQSEQQRQASEEASRLLAQIRQSTWARSTENGAQPAESEQLAALGKEVYSTGVLVLLLQNLRLLDFDARRDVASFFTFMLKRPPTVDYLLNNKSEVFTILMNSAGNVEIHHTICQILRECSHNEKLVAYMMSLQNFWLFIQYVDHSEFEVATDNFSTFQEYLRNFPELTMKFILQNMDYFTKCINGLISSKNYVARRQSLRLLFQIIKQPRNYPYLLEYTSNVESLKLIMHLLRDKSKNIHYEAFQIFKCFVVNPEKPKGVVSILVRNRQKLIEMLEKPHTLADRREDHSYQQERAYVKQKLMSFPDKSNPSNVLQNQSTTHHQQQHNVHHNGHHGHQHGHHHHAQDAKQASSSHVNQYAPQRSQYHAEHGINHINASQLPSHLNSGNNSTQPQQVPQQVPLQYNLQNLQPMQPRSGSPSRAQVPSALMNARPASPVLSHPQNFPDN